MPHPDNPAKDANDAIEMQYLRHWAGESSVYEHMGAYTKAAEMLDVHDGQRHVDFGCGLGNMLLAIKRRAMDAHVTGIDVKAHLLQQAALRLARERVQFAMYANSGFQPTSDGKLKYVHRYDPEAAHVLFERGNGPVRLICDDLRGAEVTQAVLGDTRLDSVSFMFPGGGSHLVLYHPYKPQPIDDREVSRRAREVADGVRDMVNRLAVKHVKPGGRFLMAERIGSGTTAEEVSSLIRASLGKYEKFWTHERTIFNSSILENPGTANFGWVANRAPDNIARTPRDTRSTTRARVFCATFTRNNLAV